MKICENTSFGDSASAAAVNSLKIWVDNTEDQFSGYESGRKFDCTVVADRDALAQLVTQRIQSKKPNCTMRPPAPPAAPPAARPGSPNMGGPK